MAFVKEQRLSSLSRVLYLVSNFGDITDNWADITLKFPSDVYDINLSEGWKTEDYYEKNIFKNLRDSVDDDTSIDTSTLYWEALSDYTWGRVVLLDNDWSTTVEWNKAWQQYLPQSMPNTIDHGVLTESLATLDGNWEDLIQIDRGDTVIDNQFLKYTWMSINDTWASLT